MVAKSPLPATWSVPQVFRDRLGEQVGRQRMMEAEGHLLLVLHAPPAADHPAREGRFFWRSPEGDWNSNAHGPGIKALHRHLEEYETVLQKLEQAEDRAELSRDFLPILEHIAPLCRAAGNLHQTLQSAREALPQDRDLIVCRDRSYAIHRQAELLQTNTKNALDCAIARRAEEEAAASQAMLRAAFRLNKLAALFFPIVTVAAIFGMNLDHGIPIESQSLTFWTVVVGGILVGFALKSIVVRPPDEPQRNAHRDAGWPSERS